MRTVHVRFARGWGDVQLIKATLLSEYPALDRARIELADGRRMQVSRRSIVEVARG